MKKAVKSFIKPCGLAKISAFCLKCDVPQLLRDLDMTFINKQSFRKRLPKIGILRSTRHEVRGPTRGPHVATFLAIRVKCYPLLKVSEYRWENLPLQPAKLQRQQRRANKQARDFGVDLA